MNVQIRKFSVDDISMKVEWINDPLNNKYLHYDLPLMEDKTKAWYEQNKDKTNRYDATIEVNGVPVGLIGLLGIDNKNSKAEYYITIGNREYTGKGVAYKASKLLLDYAFDTLGLNKVFLYTEYDNKSAQHLFEKLGFKKEGLSKDDLFSRGKYVSRYLYGLCRADYITKLETPIYKLNQENGNNIYIKRDDLYPFSFGGNKARKGMLFWNDIKKKKADYIITYGSSSSNHCRVIANIAASEKIPCCIISPEEIAHETYNSKMMKLFGAEIKYCKVSEVHETIEETINKSIEKGYKPYFIQGGGHGNIGTQAYVDCYKEVVEYENENNVYFDYIFHASGTGTTQAGLVCGQLMNGDERKIVGISIARKCPYGRNVVINSVKEYLGDKFSDDEIEDKVKFIDTYTGDGYGKADNEIKEQIYEFMTKYGIPLDSTYTSKGIIGMKRYIKENGIENKKILFIHTGGTPLFFDEIGD